MKKYFSLVILLVAAKFCFSQKWELVCKTQKTTDIFFIDDKTGWRTEEVYTLQKTYDSGKTWITKIEEGNAYDADTTKPPKDVYQYPYGNIIHDVFFVNSKIGWVGMDGGKGGVLTTTDGGETWQGHNKTLSQTDEAHGEPYFHNISKIYFVNSKKGWTCGIAAGEGKLGFYKSTDSGINWQIVHVDIYYDTLVTFHDDVDQLHYVVPSPELKKIFFVDSLTGWTIGDRLFVFTKDGGKTWTRDTTRFYNNLKDIFFLDRNNGWISQDNELYKTNNGGKKFDLIYEDKSDQPITTILFLDNNHGYMGVGKDPLYEEDAIIEEGDASLMETMDGGKTWKEILKDKSAFKNLQLVNNSIIYVETRDGIYKLNIKK